MIVLDPDPTWLLILFQLTRLASLITTRRETSSRSMIKMTRLTDLTVSYLKNSAFVLHHRRPNFVKDGILYLKLDFLQKSLPTTSMCNVPRWILIDDTDDQILNISRSINDFRVPGNIRSKIGEFLKFETLMISYLWIHDPSLYNFHIWSYFDTVPFFEVWGGATSPEDPDRPVDLNDSRETSDKIPSEEDKEDK